MRIEDPGQHGPARSSASPRSRFTWYASAPLGAGVSGLAKPRPDTGCFRLTLLLERLELGGPDVVGRAVSWVGRNPGPQLRAHLNVRSLRKLRLREPSA
jgi:hypothetical protein